MVRGIRGAVCAEKNTKEHIFQATSRLLKEIISRNDLNVDDIASIFITATPDINADFPAYAIRENGLKLVPVLCATEIDIPGAMKSVLRILVHVNSDKSPDEICHVYLGDARKLRPDLAGDE